VLHILLPALPILETQLALFEDAVLHILLAALPVLETRPALFEDAVLCILPALLAVLNPRRICECTTGEDGGSDTPRFASVAEVGMWGSSFSSIIEADFDLVTIVLIAKISTINVLP